MKDMYSCYTDLFYQSFSTCSFFCFQYWIPSLNFQKPLWSNCTTYHACNVFAMRGSNLKLLMNFKLPYDAKPVLMHWISDYQVRKWHAANNAEFSLYLHRLLSKQKMESQWPSAKWMWSQRPMSLTRLSDFTTPSSVSLKRPSACQSGTTLQVVQITLAIPHEPSIPRPSTHISCFLNCA